MSKHTPGPWVVIIEGLNAITDNAASWTPEQISRQAQSLAVEIDMLRKDTADALAALGAVIEVKDAIAKARGEQEGK